MTLADLVFAPAVVGIVLAWVFSWRALDELSELGMRNHTRALWALQWGPPEYFTPAGIRYRRLAWLTSLGGALATLLLAMLLL